MGKGGKWKEKGGFEAEGTENCDFASLALQETGNTLAAGQTIGAPVPSYSRSPPRHDGSSSNFGIWLISGVFVLSWGANSLAHAGGLPSPGVSL
jgi:hypothetical protein